MPAFSAHSTQSAHVRSPARFVVLGALVLSVVVSLLQSSAPASASVPVRSRHPYTPTPGLAFNDPTGSHEARWRLQLQMIRAIDAAPPGATIRMLVYSANLTQVRDALVRAHKRRVAVRLVGRGSIAHTAWWRRLAKELSTGSRSTSYAVTCARGCFSTRHDTEMHAKLLLVSRSGRAHDVVLLGSSNPTTTQTAEGWNDQLTLVGDHPAYSGLARQVDRMSASAARHDRVVGSRVIHAGRRQILVSAGGADHYARAFRAVSCGSAARPTRVQIAMSVWGASRVANAKRLWHLDDAGCVVTAVVSAHVAPAVRRWLLRPTRHGGIRVRSLTHVHEKLLMVSGTYAGHRQQVVWFGSYNFHARSAHGNDELIVRSADPGDVSAVARRFPQLLRQAKAVR